MTKRAIKSFSPNPFRENAGSICRTRPEVMCWKATLNDPVRVRRGVPRRGVQVLEALLVIPILLIAMAAFFQFGPLVIVQHATTNAAAETAREISKIYEFDINDPIDIAKAESVVNEVLGVHGITVGDPGLLVVIEDENGVACIGDASLEPKFCPPNSSITDVSEVKVTVILMLEDAPVPNVLEVYCVDLSEKRYEVCSTARKSCVP